MPFLKIVSFLAILLVSTQAAPVSAADITTNETSPNVLFNPSPGDSVNDCGNSSFTNRSSGGSPTVGDCLQIAANISGGGSWTVEDVAGLQHQLVQYGSCAFGVQGFGSGIVFHVGNQDIIDLIHSSITMFQWNGLVGSKGLMPCGGTKVEWGLYHT